MIFLTGSINRTSTLLAKKLKLKTKNHNSKLKTSLAYSVQRLAYSMINEMFISLATPKFAPTSGL